MQFHFPEGLRPATVDQRERFYREEFSTGGLQPLLERWPRFTPVVDVGTESTRYRPRFKEHLGKLVRLTEWEDLDGLRERLVDYAPEDLYYRLVLEKPDTVEVDPDRELVFDLDPEAVDCKRCDRRRTYVDEEVENTMFCTKCFAALARRTRQLYAFLENHFDDLLLLYTGRGFHIHVRDDAAFRMERDDRRQFATMVADEFPIDRPLTAGDIDITRVPGSLHGLVSRVVTELAPADLQDPDAILYEKTLPEFVDDPV